MKHGILRLAFGTLMFVVGAHAQALLLTPGTATATTDENSNLTTLAQINAAFNTSYQDVDLLFKHDTDGGQESGSLSGSYAFTNIVFDNDNEPTGGDLVYTGGAAADCPTCFLIVKGGNHTPAQYLFDLADWNGVETLVLEGFWHDIKGSISNVALWGGEGDEPTVPVPEPGTLALLGLGLVGLGMARRRRVG